MYDYQIDQEAVLSQLGQAATSPEYKAYLMGYILPLFDERLTLRFEGELSGEDLAAFVAVENDPAQAKVFVQAHFPNRSQIYSDELTKFIAELQPQPAGTAQPQDDFQLPPESPQPPQGPQNLQGPQQGPPDSNGLQPLPQF